MTFFDWTDERIATLTEMWMAGNSANTIGRELGTSRNSVIGKVHRLGLERVCGRDEPEALAASAKGRKRVQTVLQPPRPVKVEAPPPSFIPRDFSPRGHCRYIEGDVGKDWGCCDAEALRGNWCEQHAKRVHTAARVKHEADGG